MAGGEASDQNFALFGDTVPTKKDFPTAQNLDRNCAYCPFPIETSTDVKRGVLPSCKPSQQTRYNDFE